MPFLALDPADAAVLTDPGLGAPLTLEGMTLAEMRGQLNLMLGGRPDIQNGTLDYWINAAYIDMATSLEIDELKASLTFNLVASQALYLLPKVVRAVREVGVIDTVTYGDLGGRKLDKSDLARFRRSSDRTGEPTEYFREKRLLVLYPTPQYVRAVSVDIWIRPDKMVEDDDSPILPFEWHMPMLANARSIAHMDLREREAAMVSENVYINSVRRKDSPEELEEDDKIIGSSVPRDRRNLHRRHSRFNEDIDGVR